MPQFNAPCERGAAARGYLIRTGVPIATRPNRSITSGTVMRMQPCDARVPIDHGSPVPWIPTDPSTPIQRALSGLFAAPPPTYWPAISPAHGEFGAVHVGLTCLLWIANWPVGVGYAGWPTATP